jgi:tRNA A-37 threonylcarbamoyl transferase component Bud32/tetratricopeptide (TPR) repeat protein
MASTEPRVQSAPAAASDDRARLGTVIDGRYRLDALLGRGGMGVVYRGEHVAIRRAVAVKLLHPTLAAMPELRSRFEREAIAIGRIDHPNCVDVSDFGKLDDGSLFLVMELLDGRSLGDLMDAEAPLAPHRALAILRHVLSGLGHAHAAGIVHRDVKPENVYLVTRDGDHEFAKILDFGIAKVIGGGEIDDGVKLTQAGVAFGTPIYMSPEQAIGNPLDGRSDLYAASVMAFEMICGRPPFYSDDKLEILSMHTTRPPPSMTETMAATLGRPAPPVPAAVEALIVRGLAKRPDDRYRDAAAFIAAIDDIIGGPNRNTGGVRAASPRMGPSTGAEPLLDLFAAPAQMSQPVVLHAPRPRRAPRAALATLILVAAAAAGILLALALRSEPTSSALVSKPSPDTAAGKAAAQLGQGDPAGAIKAIEAGKKAAASDPDAQLQLGHAYAAQRKHTEALVAYKRALELDPTATANAELRAAVNAIVTDTDPTAAVAALVFQHAQLADASADDKLVAWASGDDLPRRTAAVAAVGKLGLGDRVDWGKSYRYDLEQGELCAHRKPVVAKLRALGDPAAIPALEQALVRLGTVGKWKGKNVNACLVDDAKAAITYLQGLRTK